MPYALLVMVAFNAADHARVAAGEITVTWRLWKYAHVKQGNIGVSDPADKFWEPSRSVNCTVGAPLSTNP